MNMQNRFYGAVWDADGTFRWVGVWAKDRPTARNYLRESFPRAVRVGVLTRKEMQKAVNTGDFSVA
jgi:hypothetical protein